MRGLLSGSGLTCVSLRAEGDPGEGVLPTVAPSPHPPSLPEPRSSLDSPAPALCLRGRPQPVQLVLGGQPLGRQCRQPAHGVARAVLVLGRHVAGGTGAGGRPGPRGGRAGRLEATTQAPAAAAAARGRPPELVGQRHRHGQPLLLLGQLLVLRGQQPGRVVRRRRVRVLAQPAARGRGARPQPVRLPAGDGRVPSARCPAATL